MSQCLTSGPGYVRASDRLRPTENAYTWFRSVLEWLNQHPEGAWGISNLAFEISFPGACHHVDVSKLLKEILRINLCSALVQLQASS